jgi:hypothetical protein
MEFEFELKLEIVLPFKSINSTKQVAQFNKTISVSVSMISDFKIDEYGTYVVLYFFVWPFLSVELNL